MIYCHKCGIRQNDSSSFCKTCGTILNQTPSVVLVETNDMDQLSDWEERKGSIFISLWITIRSILSKPTLFFGQITASRKMDQAIVFYILLTLISIPATMLYQASSYGDSNGIVATQILLQPITTLLFGLSGLYIGASLYMLLFMIVGVKKASYKETVIALCYTNAPMIFMVIPIPFVPVIVAGIWVFILQIISLATIHRCSVGKMAAIQIIPLVIVSIILGIIIALIIVIAAAAGISFTDSLKIQDILDLIR